MAQGGKEGRGKPDDGVVLDKLVAVYLSKIWRILQKRLCVVPGSADGQVEVSNEGTQGGCGIAEKAVRYDVQNLRNVVELCYSKVPPNDSLGVVVENRICAGNLQQVFNRRVRTLAGMGGAWRVLEDWKLDVAQDFCPQFVWYSRNSGFDGRHGG